MLNRFGKSIVILALLLFANEAVAQPSWPRFRGTNGAGIAESGQTLPVTFDQNNHAAWQVDVGEGHSSPVIWGDRLFLTAKNGEQLETLCIDRSSGKMIWRRAAPGVEAERVHPVNSQASPTPATDGEYVYVYFGAYGLLAYDYAGELVWQRPLEKRLRNTFGTASSPILAKDYLIFACENQTESFIEALDKKTGGRIWYKAREGFKSSWSTPIYWKNNQADELIVYGVSWLTALDLADGSDRWAVPGLADEPAITPVLGDGLVFVSSYNMKTNPEVIGLPDYSELLQNYDSNADGRISFEEGNANKSVLSRHDADGDGDHPLRIFYRMLDGDRDQHISESEYQKLIAWVDSFEQENGLIAIRPAVEPGDKAEIAWRYRVGVPEIPSPLYFQGRIYMVKNGGIVTCLNAQTGEKIYQSRLDAGGPYYASPIVGDNKIYVASARGVITVFAASDQLKILSRNQLGERIMATPAIVDGKIYVRTDKHLYAFGK